ncbi:putative CoA-transferase [Flexivirga endophytica]|uniref:CoA-transferase n=1 Tax=Flexivirga endophytica TaxID=1849103 RepID=A0A916SVF1_9MICO|nr:CoA transferase [Flexivirga endophytica]GGB18606.1 putative CoA-transferase [Flexivirga endophytica]GHB37073.1 putative CoA-transferase [Flexivirga endophytica]
MTVTSPLLRVLDLTDALGANAVRLFVGMGADVIRLRPATQPRPDEAAALHWYAGTRTRTVPDADVDLTITELVGDADIVLESGPRPTLRTLRLREECPDLWTGVAHVVLTPFGLTGPRADWLADDHVIAAAGGMAWLGGDPGRPPVTPPHEQASQLAGTHLAVAALLAALARKRTGQGQLGEVSAQEAVAATLETGAISWIHAGSVPGRTSGVYGHVAHRIFPTADGYVAGGYSGPDRMWTDLLAWMDETGEAEDLTDPIWADPVHRWKHRAHVDDVVTEWTRRRRTAVIAPEARRRALPWAEVAAPGDLPGNPQLQSRDFFVQLHTPTGAVLDAGFPYESPGRPRPVTLSVSEPVTGELPWHTERSGAYAAAWQQRTHGSGALSGLRVLDLTWVLAGPYVTKTLAEHGADIIKIESAHRQDPTRFAPSMRLRPDAGPDDSGYFLNFNRNKRSLALNLRSSEGPDLLRRLAAEVDLVIENFSPGTLAKWGLDPASLQRLNPDCLLVSMSGVGATGPWRSSVTFADTLAAWSGLTAATAGSDGIPQGFTFGLGDMVAANAAVVAILEHLLRGGGGYVDLSQLEALTAHLGTAALGAPPTYDSEHVGPRTLRAPGDDRWLAVGATDRDRLRALAGHRDPQEWLAEHAATTDADQAAITLQLHGIAAYPVRDGRDLVDHDEQLESRDFYPTQLHPIAGDIRVEGPVHHLSTTPPVLDRPAPLLGEHTDELLTELLALDPVELRRLRDQGVLQ